MYYYYNNLISVVIHTATVTVTTEGVDREGGGTGIRWAESGVEGAESGGGGGGIGGGGGGERGKRGRGAGIEGAGSLERLGRKIDFFK